MRRAISYVVDIELLQRRQQCRRDAHGMKERLNLASAFFIAHFTLRHIVRLGLSLGREDLQWKNAGGLNILQQMHLLLWYLDFARVDTFNHIVGWLAVYGAADTLCSTQDLLHTSRQLLGQ